MKIIRTRKHSNGDETFTFELSKNDMRRFRAVAKARHTRCTENFIKGLMCEGLVGGMAAYELASLRKTNKLA